jgi:hypothetical protein
LFCNKIRLNYIIEEISKIMNEDLLEDPTPKTEVKDTPTTPQDIPDKLDLDEYKDQDDLELSPGRQALIEEF